MNDDMHHPIQIVASDIPEAVVDLHSGHHVSVTDNSMSHESHDAHDVHDSHELHHDHQGLIQDNEFEAHLRTQRFADLNAASDFIHGYARQKGFEVVVDRSGCCLSCSASFS